MPRSVDVVDDDAATMAAETPVFVDATGRRRKILRRLAVGGVVLIIGYVAVLVAALFGAPIPSPLLVPVTALGPAPTEAVTTPPPSDPASSIPDGHPEQGAGSEAAWPGAGAGPSTHETPATSPKVAGSAGQQPSVTVTSTPVPGIDHHNSHAPDVPPGKSDTSKNPRP